MERWRRFGSAAAALVVIGACCGACWGGSQPTAQPSVTSPSDRAVSVVAIGDSDATGVGDATSRGWVGRYADLLHAELGVPVTVDNRAAEGKTSEDLRREVGEGAALRHALAGADVILIGVGGADLNAGDDALDAGSCKGDACYAGILRRFHANMSAIVGRARRLAPSALLRAMSLPNAYPGAGAAIPPFITAHISRHQVTSERSSVCHAMRSNGGRCVDVVKAFNGPSANGDAYASGLMTKDPCCYASGKGQQLIARLLIATGVGALAKGHS
jgi:lysophospholipase L1-like esterase